jgi:5-methylcytosine-specific restriction protein A
MVSTLKPRVQTLRLSRIAEAPRAGSTPRMSGEAQVKRRLRWLNANPLCVKCNSVGRTAAAEQVDHVIPLSNGGADDESNFQSLCVPCHKEKTAREQAERFGKLK